MACFAWAGTEEYGAWLKREDVKDAWKPQLKEDVLECLGPENCAGLDCEIEKDSGTRPSKWEEWSKCAEKQLDSDERPTGCYKWYPKLVEGKDPQQKNAIKQENQRNIKTML